MVSPAPGAPRAAIVAIGNELLFGETVDTNSSWLGRTLAAWGVPVVAGLTVGDLEADIADAVGRALGVARLVVVTGGLGPTRDDVTKEAVARVLGRGLVRDEETARRVRERFAAAGYERMPQASEGQALVIEGAVVLANDFGTAPGQLLLTDEAALVLLPGVPDEMRGIVSGALRPRLEEAGFVGPPLRHRVLHTTGIPESKLTEIVEPAWAGLSSEARAGVGLAYLPGELGVNLRLSVVGGGGGDDEDVAAALLEEVERVLGDAVAPFRFDAPSGDLAHAVVDALRGLGLTLATAESCTGGLVAQRLTAIRGASQVYRGSVVAYDNRVKETSLGVPASVLSAHGAVSEETARRMASGARAAMGVDVAVSVTGVAGPGGGSDEKPVGTVWIAVADGATVTAEQACFAGDRGAVRRQAAQAALAAVYRRVPPRRGSET